MADVPKQPGSETVEGGNKFVLGSTPNPNATKSRVEMIIDKTEALAFPTEPVLALENFEHGGDRPAGYMNSVDDMQNLSGKVLQESYRQGTVNKREMASYTEKVSDR